MIKPVSLTNVSIKRGINFAQANSANVTAPIMGCDTVSFKGRKTSKTKLKEIGDSAKISASKVLDRSAEIARQYGSKEIKEEHTLLACLEVLDKYIEDLDSGATYYGAEQSSDMRYFMESIFDTKMFKSVEKRKKIKPIIKDEIKILNDMMAAEGKKKTISKPSMNPDHLTTMYAIWDQDKFDDNIPFSDTHILNASLYSDDDEYTKRVALPFRRKLQETLMLDHTKLEDSPHLKFYDDKARNLWRNLAVGTNMFILHDKNVNPQYLIDSFKHVINDGEKFGKLDSENVEIISFNNNATNDYISHKIRRASADTSKSHVFIVPTGKDQFNFSPSLEETFKKPPKDSKFVIVSEKDLYYQTVDHQGEDEPFADYGEVTVPILNTDKAKQVFRDEAKVLTKKINKEFEPEAIDKCVEVAATLAGNYPEKAQKVMGLVASYYIDKKDKITADDVVHYVQEAKEIFKPVDADSSIVMQFDTGKKLDDMVGAKGTKEEAKSIIRQIKEKTIGTKGYIVYSQDGYPGAGRRHMAQVVAGEAKIPYIEINALDFGTKDVDLFGGGNLTPEASMKKLFSLAKSQAETNESKAAVLFIENFEYFSVGEQVSEYHQKAMSQLLREMTNAQKQGLNILVMGSMSDPSVVGESMMKSFKFIDEIEVESPAFNTDSRKEILEYYINKKGIKIDGETKEEIDKVIQSAAETTSYFPLVQLLAFLDKAQNVANERGKEKIQKEDFIEAFLQITTGRPSYERMEDPSSEIISAHEGGHAVTGYVMDKLLNKEGKSWQKSLKIDFITLDPRSTYGGAVYFKEPESIIYTLYDVLGELVVDFGGNSSEKLLYGFDGSRGITADMKSMTQRSKEAIQHMCLGPNVGKISIQDTLLGEMDISPQMREKFDKDMELFANNTSVISDKIVWAYSSFIKEFANKYKDKVGTGECLIPSEQFEAELEEWISKQTPEKQEELKKLESEIRSIMEKTKKGEMVHEN